MARFRHDVQTANRGHPLERLPVQLDHLTIAATDDEQRRRSDDLERAAGKIGPAATRHDGTDVLGPFGRGHERSGGAHAAAEEADCQIPRLS